MKRSNVLIAAGMAAALLGVVSVLAYGRSVESSAKHTVSAWTAADTIAPGTKGEEVAKRVTQVKVPVSLRPDIAIAAPGDLNGRIAVRQIAKGEVITGAQFGATGTAAQPTVIQIPPGYNAVSLSLPAPQAVGRFVRPGDLVNIFATPKEGAGTKLLLQNVQVLADGANGADEASKFAGASGGEVMLTMALRPGDVQQLVQARESGSVWLALVSAAR